MRKLFAAGTCALALVAGAASAADVEVRTALAGAFAQLRARMTEALASAGTPHAEGLAVLIVATYEGGLLQARVANSVLPLQLATDTLGALIRAQPAAAA